MSMPTVKTATSTDLQKVVNDPFGRYMGLGAALLKHTLQICDSPGQTAYLESSNPQNISIYERHGFEIVDEIRIDDCPVLTPMLRPAR